MATQKLAPRQTYGTAGQNYFGWDLRATAWKCIHWQRSPRLSAADVENWPYRFESASDMTPDFSITVWGDPSAELLTAWVEEEESGAAMTCLAK